MMDPLTRPACEEAIHMNDSVFQTMEQLYRRPGVRSRVALVVVAATILTGCSSVPIPPTYTQDELKAICQRNGGHWQPDELTGGFCRMNSGKG